MRRVEYQKKKKEIRVCLYAWRVVPLALLYVFI